MAADDFKQTADRIPGAFKTLRETTMQKVVLVALAASQKRTPVKSGTLRRSETTRVEAGGMRGFVGTNVRYAPFVHDGTRYMAARPFFEQGIGDAQPQIAHILQDAGDAFTAEVAGR